VASLEKLKHALEHCVAGDQCQFLTYGEFGKQFKFGHPRPWATRTVLDAVAAALKQDPQIGLDLTFLLRNWRTKYPSVTDGKSSKPPTPQQKVRARVVAQQIIDRYCPGTKNPY
jgi:UDP:flavonoid glycosyltransferase YjiC (YdhE family)